MGAVEYAGAHPAAPENVQAIHVHNGDARAGNLQTEGVGFYVLMAFTALAAATAGLAATIFSFETLADATLTGGRAILGYGALAFVWCALLVWQARAKHARRRSDIGCAAAVLAVVIALAAPHVGVRLAAQASMSEAGISPFLSLLAATILFLTCVAAGLFNQDRPDAYKRFMLLATAALLWPLWMRLRLAFFPGATELAIVAAPLLADLAILVAMARDRFILKAVHPVYMRMGAVIIAAHVAEVVAYDSAPWRAAAKALFSIFSASALS